MTGSLAGEASAGLAQAPSPSLTWTRHSDAPRGSHTGAQQGVVDTCPLQDLGGLSSDAFWSTHRPVPGCRQALPPRTCWRPEAIAVRMLLGLPGGDVARVSPGRRSHRPPHGTISAECGVNGRRDSGSRVSVGFPQWELRHGRVDVRWGLTLRLPRQGAPGLPMPRQGHHALLWPQPWPGPAWRAKAGVASCSGIGRQSRVTGLSGGFCALLQGGPWAQGAKLNHLGLQKEPPMSVLSLPHPTTAPSPHSDLKLWHVLPGTRKPPLWEKTHKRRTGWKRAGFCF